MSEENIVKRVCKELGITQREALKYNDYALKGFYLYHTQNLDSVKLTKKEQEQILKKLSEYNKLNISDENKADIVRGLLNDDYKIVGDTLYKNSDPFSFLEPFVGKLKDKEIINVDFIDITPKFIKELTKAYSWTYKDLAENIGAVETTVRNWMSKGEIPEWAKKSISYIVTIKKIEKEKEYLKNDLDEISSAIRTLLSVIKRKYDDT